MLLRDFRLPSHRTSGKMKIATHLQQRDCVGFAPIFPNLNVAMIAVAAEKSILADRWKKRGMGAKKEKILFERVRAI